jgi:hypothetical protein
VFHREYPALVLLIVLPRLPRPRPTTFRKRPAAVRQGGSGVGKRMIRGGVVFRCRHTSSNDNADVSYFMR